MDNIQNESKRRFLINVGTISGSLVLGFKAPTLLASEKDEFPRELTHWILINEDNTTTVRIARSELGQGTFTGLVQLVCEELESDWDTTKPEYADVNMHIKRNRIFKSMTTGGSRGIRDSQQYIREAGAFARNLLLMSAAQKWKVNVNDCYAQKSHIIHKSGKSFKYSQLLSLAKKIKFKSDFIKLKNPDEWKIIGTSPQRFDIPDKVNGKQIFASDVILPKMVFASIMSAPVFGAKVKKIDDQIIKDDKNILKIINNETFVAIVSNNWWRANNALNKIKIEWTNTNNDNVSSKSISEFLTSGLETESSPIARRDGLPEFEFSKANEIIENTYSSGFLNHATMEPQNATVIYTKNRVDVWCGTQNGESTAVAASKISGVPLEKIYVHKHHAGGGFGRRVAHQDFTEQATKIAMSMPGIPVRLQWSREEDMKQGRYRPVSKIKMKAGFDKKNNLKVWSAKQSDQSIAITVFPKWVKNGIDLINTRCFRDNPYKVSHFLNEYSMRNTHVPPGFWRAVAHTNNPFARESFIDEIANKANKDLYEFRRDILSGTKDIHLLDAVADKIDWYRKTENFHKGIAVVDSYGSYTAAAVELSVKNKKIKVKKVVVAINPGYVVNPDAVKAQIESGVIWGLSAFMHEEITINNGKVNESNFNDYPILKLSETPEIIPLIVPSGGFWGGVGEPPIGAVIPALANAIFKSTGVRVTSMPIRKLGFSYI